MKTYERRALPALAAAMAVLDLVLMSALRSAWPGIGAALRLPALPYVLAAAMAASAATSVVLLLWRAPRALVNGLLGLSVFFLGAILIVVARAFGYWPYFLRESLIGLAWAAAAAALIFLLYRYPRTRLAGSAVFRITALLVAALAFAHGVLGIGWLRLDHGPAVWAVGDEYQIAFTTTTRTRAWIEVGGEVFHDSYAGSDVSEARVHKIAVPMAALDAARSYTVHVRSMLLRGPYGALQGRSVSETVPFRPVDASDGIQAYALSDTHMFPEPAVRAAACEGDALDFLIVAGDTSSFLDRPADLALILDLAHGITGGGRPAVYARGNHETKGLASSGLNKYVGADGERFRYSFRLGPVWGVVLDLGEDHADNWWEYAGTARFDGYREEQTRFLDSLVARAEAPDRAGAEYRAAGVEWRLAVCHIPLTLSFTGAGDYATAVKKAWIERLDRMGIDLLVDGHLHQAMYVPTDQAPGLELRRAPAFTGGAAGKSDGYRLPSAFPAVVVSRRSREQTNAVPEDLAGRRFFGLSIETARPESGAGKALALRFTDDRGRVLRTVNAWTGADQGEVILVPSRSPAGDPPAD